MISNKEKNYKNFHQKDTKIEGAQPDNSQEEAAKAETKSEEIPNEEPVEKDELAEAKAEIDELKDKYLRQVAEFDNYRKRMLKEKSELILNGGEKVITALLPILDDFERALKNADKDKEKETLKQGVELIFQKFMKTLESNGLTKIETEGADFDTDFHEAIAMIPAEKDDDKGKVVDCVQTGYKLNDKVIRHAKVAVGQ